MSCTCGELKLGGRRTGSFNLNLDCPEHGADSDWYNSDEQRAKREAQRERTRDLQRRARAARQRP